MNLRRIFCCSINFFLITLLTLAGLSVHTKAQAKSKVVSESQRLPKQITKTKRIFTNAVIMDNAPSWLTTPRVEKLTQHIENKLEWSTRRIHAYWYYKESDFQKVHHSTGLITAFTLKKPPNASMYLGPRVTIQNFDQIFSHEMVHIIAFQKYKSSIPAWLEEGLANHLSKRRSIDYKWLAKHKFPKDVTQMIHPLHGSKNEIFYHYAASQALAEMLDKKCGLENLIRLSVQRKMENYIETYCEIKDLNQEFKKWVLKKSKFST